MLPDRLSRLLILISAGMSFASPGQALTMNEALAIRLATPNDITRSSVAPQPQRHATASSHRRSCSPSCRRRDDASVLEKTNRRLPGTGDPVGVFAWKSQASRCVSLMPSTAEPVARS